MFLCLQFLNKLKSWWQSPSLSTWNSPRWFLDAQKHCWRWAKKRFTNRTSNTTKTKSPIREKKVILGNSRDDPPWLLQPDMRTLGELGRGNYFNWKGLERPLYSGVPLVLPLTTQTHLISQISPFLFFPVTAVRKVKSILERQPGELDANAKMFCYNLVFNCCSTCKRLLKERKRRKPLW